MRSENIYQQFVVKLLSVPLRVFLFFVFRWE